MNRSGVVIPELLSRFGASSSDLLVVFDQMDLPPGRLRLKPHGSSAGHNGLKSIDEFLTEPYHRLAVGIGRPEVGQGVVEHVLGTPSVQDFQAVKSVLDRVVPQVHQRWTEGWEPLIHAVNQRHSYPS